MQTAKNAAVQTVSTSAKRSRAMVSRMLLATTALVAGSNAAYALPSDPVVEAGNINFQQPASNHLVINNASDKGIINWKGGFDIGANEITSINQNGAHAILLNKVYTGKMTEILGQLTSNGRVVVVNPNGVFFGSGSKVDVAGMIATTAGISNENFLKGNMKFDQAGKDDASIINQGTITAAEGGLVALVAPSVRNDGVISAKLGTIMLGAAKTFSIDMYGDNLYSFKLGEAATAKGKDKDGNALEAAVGNNGVLAAEGGTIYLTANVAKGVVDKAINTTGIIEANSARVDKTGAIILDGGDHGAVTVSGRVTASGKHAGRKGGKVTVTGEKVTVKTGAVIDVSGNAGGGTALIGGDKEGKGTIRLAKETTLEAGATIDASTDAGTAGDIVLWSEELTNFHGDLNISSTLGDGGFAEISSRESFLIDGNIDGSAAGKLGTVLLDPKKVTITNLPNSDLLGLNNIRASWLVSQLNFNNITVNTAGASSVFGDGNISVLADVVWSGKGTLTLDAANDIIVNADIKSSYAGTASEGGISLKAGNDISIGNVLRDVTLSTVNGTISLLAGNNIDINADGLGSARISTNGNAKLTATNGTVSLRSGMFGQDSSVEAANIEVIAKGLKLATQSSGIGGDSYLRAANNLTATINGNVTLNGGAFLQANNGLLDVNQTGTFFSDSANVLRNSAGLNGSIFVNQNVGGSIQNAINAIGATGTGGATVQIGKGDYTENLDVAKSLTLEGAGNGNAIGSVTRIIGAGGVTPVINVHGLAANGTVVKSMIVDGRSRAQDAIHATDTNNVKISGVQAFNAKNGFIFSNAKNAVIENSEVNGGTIAVGLYNASDNATVRNNTLSNLYVAVDATMSDTVSIRQNTIDNAQIGVNLYQAQGTLSIDDNSFQQYSMQDGVVAQNGALVSITNNRIGGTNRGIFISNNNGSSISGNTLSGNTSGIVIENGTGANAISTNSLLGNGDKNGIAILNTDAVQITGNTLDFSASGANPWGGLGTAIAVTDSDNVTISGGTIKGAGGYYNVKANNSDRLVVSGVGIDGGKIGVGLANGSDNATISGNSIRNQYVGVDAQGVNGVEISGNTVTNAATAILVENASGTVNILTNTINSWINQVGIHVKNTANAVLTGNNVDYADRAIWIDGSNAAQVTGGKITRSNTAVRINPSANVVVDGLEVDGGTTGVELVSSTNATVKNSTIKNVNNGIFASAGSNGLTVQDNTISNVNTHAVAVSGSTGLKAFGNSINGAGNGFMVAAGSHGAEINNNTVKAANGVAISYSNGANLHNNTITGSTVGVKAVGANGLTVKDNSFTVAANATGVSVKDSSGSISIDGNSLTGNGDSNGIAVINTDGAQVTGNGIDFSAAGANPWAGLGTAIAVTDSDDVTISGGSIKSAGGMVNVKASNSDNLFVSGATINGGKIGVGLYNGSDNATVFNNTISNQYVGVDAQGVAGVNANFNTITNAATAILAENVTGTVNILSNTINSWINQVGIHVKNVANASIFNNMIDYADRGIWVDGSSNVTVLGGRITNSNTGIRVNPSDNVVIDAVNVIGGTTGIELVDSTNVKLKNSTVTDAQTGVKLTNTDGEINKVTIKGGTIGIDASANAGTNRTVKITNKTKVTDFSTTGIQLSGGNLTANVDDTTVTGKGITSPITQSGIFFTGGAKGSAKNNTLSNFASSNPNGSAAAIHIRNAGDEIEVSGNSITGTGTTGNYGVGVHVNSTNNTLIKNNSINNTGWGISVNGANNVLDGNFLGTTSANRVNATVYGASSADIKNNSFGSASDVSLELAGYAGGYVNSVSLTNNSFNFTTTFIRNNSQGLVVVSTPDKGNVFKKSGNATSYDLTNINDLLAMEDKIDHDMDHVSGYGHVVLKDGWNFATTSNLGIQRAIDLSSNNGTVQAGAGTFNETLNITGKNVDLFGLGEAAGGTLVKSVDTGKAALVVENANSNIAKIKFDGNNKANNGIKFDNAGGSVDHVAVSNLNGSSSAVAGINAVGGAGRDLSITNSSFSTKNGQTGVHVKNYSDATLANLSISNTGAGSSAYGIWIDGNAGTSLAGTTVSGGSITGANVGIRINPSSYVGVSGVAVNGGSTAIELVGSDHVTLSSNSINGANVGIKATANSHHLTATGNSIVAPNTTLFSVVTGKQGDNGILVEDSQTATLNNNTITAYKTGISLKNSGNGSVISGNTISAPTGVNALNGIAGINLENSSDTTISNNGNLAVANSGISNYNTGIRVKNSDNVDILSNRIDGSRNAGIYATDADDLTVDGNTIQNVVTLTGFGDGVRVDTDAATSNTTTITHNTISNATGNAIYVGAGTGATVNNNSISTARHGIVLKDRDYALIQGNSITNILLGNAISTDGGDFVLVGSLFDPLKGNSITNALNGIVAKNGAAIAVLNNQVTALNTGISFDTVNFSAIGLNTVNAGATGINLINTDSTRVEKNTVQAIATGINGINASRAYIGDNSVLALTGVKLLDGANVTVDANTIDAATGVDAEDTLNLGITNNQILALNTGVKLLNGSATTVEGNVIAATTGVDAQNVNGLDILTNMVAANTGVKLNSGQNAAVNGNYVLALQNAVEADAVDGLTIADNVLLAGNTGVKLTSVNNATIDQNLITATVTGIDATQGQVMGVSKNVIIAGTTGVKLDRVWDTTLDENAITAVMGVDSSDSGYLLMQNNVILASDTGIRLNGDMFSEARDNVIVAANRGVDLYDTLFTNLQSNAITAGNTGVFMRQSNGVTVLDNLIVSGNDGVVLRSGGADIGRNMIIANAVGVDARNANAIGVWENTILSGATGVKLRNSSAGVFDNQIVAGGNGVDVRNGDTEIMLNDIVAGDIGIKLRNSDNAQVNSNQILAANTGVDVRNSDNLALLFNGIAAGTTGVKLERSDNATLWMNGIAAGSTGVDVLRSNGLTVIENAVVAGDTGVRLVQSDDAGVYRNLIVAQNHGVDVDASQRIQVNLNAIFGNGSANSQGITIANGSDDAFMQANLIAGYDNGIRISNSDGVTARDSLLVANRRGINVLNGSDNTLIDNNWVLFSDDGIVVNGGDSNTVSDNHVLFATNDGIRVNGTSSLDVHGNNVQFVGRDGISVANADGASIVGNQIGSAGRDGIHVRNANAATISQNDVQDAARDGIHVRNSDDVVADQNTVARAGRDGIRLVNSLRALFTANNVSDSLNGIHLITSNFATLDGNTVTGNTEDGIWIESSDNVNLTGNTVSGSKRGVNVDGSNNTVIAAANIINGNSVAGILVANGSANTTVSNNTISNNAVGLDALNVAGLTVSNNSFTTNDTGLSADGVTGLTVTNDSFTNNALAAKLINTNNATFSGTIFTGNAVGVNLDNSDNTRIENATFTTPVGGNALEITNGSGGTRIKDVVFNGGNVAILIDGAGSDMQFEGNGSRFTGMNYYFVLQNGAMFGQVLDASAQIFDGTRASDFTVTQRDAAEAKTIDVADLLSVGDVFYKSFPFDNSALNSFQRDRGDLFRGGLFSYAGRTISPDLNQTAYKFELGSVNLSLLGQATGGAAGAGAAQFANLSTAAGGPGTGAGSSADQLADLSPAAGGSSSNCGNGFLSGGYTPGFSAANCSAQ